LDGAAPKRVINADSKAVYHSGHLLFVRQTTLLAQPFDDRTVTPTGDAVPIAENVRINPLASRAAFSASQQVLLYRLGGRAPSQLTWFDRGGTRLSTLGEPGAYEGLALSPDDKRLAAAAIDDTGSADLWIFDVVRGLRNRFTFDPALDQGGAVWSPDGTRIIYRTGKRPHPTLMMRASDGTGSERMLMTADDDAYPDSWSPDGRYLLFEADKPVTSWDLGLLSLTGAEKARPFVQAPTRQEYGKFSPDGRWVAYRSNESGRFDIYVTTFPGPGGRWQVSTAGGEFPLWRRDGKELFYIAPDNTLMAAPVNGTGAAFEIGDVKPLFRLPTTAANRNYQYAVTADGRRFVVSSLVQEQSLEPLSVIVNWPTAVKK
jgi:Tol biopolymer transport system component